jgi:hypothetical protein
VARADVSINSFAAGEVSPRMKGRTDHEKYFIGADTMLNMVPLPQGGATRRPGTELSDFVYDQSSPPRLIPFTFSVIQAYMLEFGQGYIRVFMDGSPVLYAGGEYVTISTPYAWQDLPRLKYVQSADVLLLFHANYVTYQLSRTSHLNWTLTPVEWIDGPYLPTNTNGAATLVVTDVTGIVTVTASDGSTINNGAGFLTTDVGRLIRFSSQLVPGAPPPTDDTSTAAYGYLKIIAYVDPLRVTCTVGAKSGKPMGGLYPATLDGTGPTINWALGMFSATTGYPYCGMFFQERLCLGGNNESPNTVWGSVTGDFFDMSPTDWDGAVLDSSAFAFTLDDDEVNAILWMHSAGTAQSPQLGIGTTGGEFIMLAGGNGASITPTNVQIYRETELGSSATAMVEHIGKSVLFVNEPGLKLHEWTFQWTVDGFVGPDLAALSEHLPKPGITQLTYQRVPYGVVWCMRSDGGLIGMTYLKDEQVVAWHRHQLGGDIYSGPPRVESLACIPAPDGTYDQLWLAVLRTINDVPTRYIEIMTRFFDGELQAQEEAWFVDCALQKEASAAACRMLGPKSGKGVRMVCEQNVMTSDMVGDILLFNGGAARIAAVPAANDFAVDYIRPARQGGTAIIGNWSIGHPAPSVSGLGHLAGLQVSAQTDGGDGGKQILPTSGVLTFDQPKAFAVVGLPYLSRLVTMPFEPPRAPVSAQGRIKRINFLFLRFLEAMGCRFGAVVTDEMTGVEEENTETLTHRFKGAPIGWAPPLFTGVQRVDFPGGYDREGQVVIETDGPLPLTVLYLGLRGDVGAMAPSS